MDNKLPIRRLIICGAIAVAAVGLGYYNVLYSYFEIINVVFQTIIAAVGLTAIGEIFAVLSKFPIISYVISAVICSVALQIMTPWYIIMPNVDLTYPERFFNGYRLCVRGCLLIYSIALVASVLFGIFVLHRKDIFKADK